jgi:hypothetical protein
VKDPSNSTAIAGLSGYQAMVHEATGAPRHLLALLENIMRNDVFHSTLDWQTRAQFDRGARQAYTLYRRDSAFYDASATLQAAAFELTQAETAVSNAQASGSKAASASANSRAASARADFALAQAAFDRACDCQLR